MVGMLFPEPNYPLIYAGPTHILNLRSASPHMNLMNFAEYQTILMERLLV